jgi:hypothetical protein
MYLYYCDGSYAAAGEFNKVQIPTSLAATMVRWFDGGVNQGLLPMTISDEESNLFCAHAIY